VIEIPYLNLGFDLHGFVGFQKTIHCFRSCQRLFSLFGSFAST